MLVARFSKCDFWIPGKFLIYIETNPQTKYTFSRSKMFLEKKQRKIFFEIKNFLFEKVKIIYFLKHYRTFQFSLTFSKIFQRNSKNISPIFYDKHFWSWKFLFWYGFFLYQSQNFPGIQKSHLENRATILESRAAPQRAIVIFRGIPRKYAETRKF